MIDPQELANSFLADDFEPGDRYSLNAHATAIFRILTRTDRPGEMIEFRASRRLDVGAEPVEYVFTYPARQMLSARLRIRKQTLHCRICRTPCPVDLDTAYTTLISVVCPDHQG